MDMNNVMLFFHMHKPLKNTPKIPAIDYNEGSPMTTKGHSLVHI